MTCKKADFTVIVQGWIVFRFLWRWRYVML